MALVPYTITALAESDAVGTDGKNIVAGAVCSMYSQPSDTVVTLYDDAAGSNGSTSKVTGANGQVVVYVDPGSYRVSVNAVDSYTLVGAEKQTTLELINSTRTYQTGDTITTSGFTTAGDGGGAQWLATATTGQTPSQTPAQLANAELTDGSGRKWILSDIGGSNTQAFGAIADGVADDTLAIQAQINASTISATLPDKIAFTEIVLKNNFRLSGGLITAGRILCSSVTDVVVSGLMFDYSFVNSGTEAIYINSSKVRVESCDFERLGNQYPIRFRNSSVEIIGNRINNCTYGIENINVATPAEVFANFNESILIANNVISTVAGSAINITGVVDSPPSATWVSGWDRANSIVGSCVINGNVIQDITGYAVSYRSWDCVFSDNIVKNSQPPTFQGGNITCTSNHLKNMTTVAIDFGNVSLGVCSNNVVDTCEYAAVEINSCSRVTVSNNTLSGYSTVTTSGKASAGIWLHGDSATLVPSRTCEYVTVTGNQLNVGTGSALYGISVEDTGSKAIVSYNQMQGAATTTEIVTDSLKVRAVGNMNDFAYDNDRINVDGALTDITLPSAP